MVRHGGLWVWAWITAVAVALVLFITLLLRKRGRRMRRQLAKYKEAVEDFLEDLWEQIRCTSRKVWLFIKRLFRNLFLGATYAAMVFSTIWEKVLPLKEQGWCNISTKDAVIAAVVVFGSLAGLVKEWQDAGSDNEIYLKELAVRLSERLTEVLGIRVDVAVFARRGRRFAWVTGSDLRFQSQIWTSDQYPVGTHEEDFLSVCAIEDLILCFERFETYRAYRSHMERKRARGLLSEDQWSAMSGLRTLITYELPDRRGTLVGRYVLYSEEVLPVDLTMDQDHAKKVQFVLDYYADAITLRLV